MQPIGFVVCHTIDIYVIIGQNSKIWKIKTAILFHLKDTATSVFAEIMLRGSKTKIKFGKSKKYMWKKYPKNTEIDNLRKKSINKRQMLNFAYLLLLLAKNHYASSENEKLFLQWLLDAFLDEFDNLLTGLRNKTTKKHQSLQNDLISFNQETQFVWLGPQLNIEMCNGYL